MPNDEALDCGGKGKGREQPMDISMGFGDPIITTYGPTLCSKMMDG